MSRLAFAVVAAASLASCAYPGYPPGRPPAGILLLGNSRTGEVGIEAVVTANPDCNARTAGYVGTARFSLPVSGTRFISAPAGTSVCWRRVGTAGPPAPWNRTYLSPGEFVDTTI